VHEIFNVLLVSFVPLVARDIKMISTKSSSAAKPDQG